MIRTLDRVAWALWALTAIVTVAALLIPGRAGAYLSYAAIGLGCAAWIATTVRIVARILGLPER